MLSDRITALFALLQCNNTQIARFAGCSSGNISKLKTGNRVPKPTSRSITSFVNGVYGYADYENMLPLLEELCGAENTSRETLIPALIAWLYDTENLSLPHSAVTPKSKQVQARQRQIFGERLDRVMTLLSLSNGRLAALLNIDVSLVSRYRSGIYSPHENNRISEKLSTVLMEHAKKKGEIKALADLCGASAEDLNTDTVTAWLYDTSPEEDKAAMAQQLLRSLDDFIPGTGLPAVVPEVPAVPISSRYVGTDGLRSAVVRFLSDAACEGGELLLYSDEPMDWLSGDRAYFALWASLMVNCVNSGVKIRIIHNVDRKSSEMVDAIKGWFPLYISGMIEPYVFRRERNPRFHHTVFLRPDGACILGFFPVGADKDRSYDYVTDREYLSRLKHEYDAMLSAASPLLEVYTDAMSDKFHENWISLPGKRDYLLNEFPIVTAPESLMIRMLSRIGVSEEQRAKVLSRHRELRRQFEESLREYSVNMVLCLPERALAMRRHINITLSLTGLSIAYTEEEYAEHIAAIIELVQHERNFHLALLPQALFQDIQIVTQKDAVIVLRCQEPYAAFVFRNTELTESVSDYLVMLMEQHAEDRRTTVEMLDKLKFSTADRK
ncbi:hypothetical protein NE626_14600 [Intestinimonas massiliensis]|uniref:hypothetical protein n=1 Tax=Intestinimonas massiliensis (ex Afouda et al. 2020) TaxID=1673721 RepID=UPI00210E2BFC|nr:hypothetical protein [Intestinimonas massiliensis (ex Afouda et al. 2020)]MCQ4808023.1 hypothetical protein [Intestinimonas massiliensis (ex Afouda et al. 2020)]